MIFILICLLFSSCKTTSVPVNFPSDSEQSISVVFKNNSLYKTEIVCDTPDSTYIELTLEPGEIKEKSYLYLSKTEHSLFFFPRFLIPLEDTAISIFDRNICYRIETKNGLYQSIIIETPQKCASAARDYYVILKNNSQSEISVMNSSSRQLYLTMNKTKSIPGNKSGIFLSSQREFIHTDAVNMLIQDKNREIVFPAKNLKGGFVYTYDYDGNSATLTDFRPIEKMAEQTWDCTIPESVSVCRLTRHSDSSVLYVAGAKMARDERGSPLLRGAAGKIMLPGDSGAGGTFVAYTPFEADGDVQFFDAAVSDGGELVAVGQLSVEEPCGIIVRYTADGAVSDFVAAEETVALGALCQKNGSSFFAGGIDSGGNIVVMSVSCGTSTECQNIALLAMPDGEAVDSIQLCYCAAEDCALLAVNFNGQGVFSSSRLYRIAASGEATEIDIQGKIGAVSAIIPNQDGDIFLAGEAAAGAQAAACILAVRSDGSSCETQFISPESPSWISDAWLDADSGELVICGMTTQGKKRVPFLRAFDVRHFQTAWEQSYSAPAFKGMNDALFVLPCADYGFFVGMSALDADNRRQAPFKIVHVTSSGRITEQHKTIQLQGAFTSK
ncbi:MAG: hypothetical protein HDR55_08025 [Treponema sp.]|nr:hypothetical protein [Treponema sp.]